MLDIAYDQRRLIAQFVDALASVQGVPTVQAVQVNDSDVLDALEKAGIKFIEASKEDLRLPNNPDF